MGLAAKTLKTRFGGAQKSRKSDFSASSDKDRSYRLGAPISPGMTTIIKPGDFACVTAGPPVGPLIEVASWIDNWGQADDELQDYEHAEVYVGMPDKNAPYGYTCSAYPNRQGLRPLTGPPEQLGRALWSSGIVLPTDAQRLAIVGWALDHQHVKYSAADYLALTAHRLGLSTARLQRYINDDKSMICSQFVTLDFLAAGLPLFPPTDWPGFVKPLDLAKRLQNLVEAGQTLRSIP